MRDIVDRNRRSRRASVDAGRESEVFARARREPVRPLVDALDAFSRANVAFDVGADAMDMRRDDKASEDARGSADVECEMALSKYAGRERDARVESTRKHRAIAAPGRFVRSLW